MTVHGLAEPVPAPIDPFASCAAPGRYEDDLVVVERGGAQRPRRLLRSARTEHFDVSTDDGRLHVVHSVPDSRVDDDLAGLLAVELFGPGWVSGAELFERIFTGVVLSVRPEPLEGWELFYRNTLHRLELLHAGGAQGTGDADHSSLAGYAPVHAHVHDLVLPGPVLELGACFGFLSLGLARRGHDVTASDVQAGTVSLLAAVAPRLGLPLSTVVADAARVPLPDRSTGTVLMVHLLEHLDAEDGRAAMAEALRLATRRVVVAVPLEDEPTAAYGHVRTVSLEDLRAWGRHSGATWDVHEHHGGWLVLDL